MFLVFKLIVSLRAVAGKNKKSIFSHLFYDEYSVIQQLPSQEWMHVSKENIQMILSISEWYNDSNLIKCGDRPINDLQA